jgi:hypothetical protein
MMTMEPSANLHDGLSRMLKLALDTGEAGTVDEARALFARYRIHLAVGEDAAASPTCQAAVLTAVNAGRRCFLGGVAVAGPLESRLLVPWRSCQTLGEAIRDLQGQVVNQPPADTPILAFGDVQPESRETPLMLRATTYGWTAAVAPPEYGRRRTAVEFTPAGVLAGAIGVSETFQFLRGTNALAGRREIGLSLWKPEEDFRIADSGPSVTDLPSRIWMIGLGHLGQAVLWTLGLLPYNVPGALEIVLQDFDELVEANDSTSLLTDLTMIGRRKARSMASWCEQRGFRTVVVERRFASDFTIAADEPGVAICGVDNPIARAALEDVGFSRIVEAGLGAGPSEYLAFQVHSFPGRKSARARWGNALTTDSSRGLLNQPAYRGLREQGVDECGLLQLAGRTVGAAFVGSIASCLVVAELVRMAHGFHRYELIDGTLRSFEGLTALHAPDCAPYNPGTTKVSGL